MRLLLSLLMVLVAGTGFGFDFDAAQKSFSFEGKWKSLEGKAGKWTSETTFSSERSEAQTGQVMTMTSQLKVYEGQTLLHEMQSVLSFRGKGKGFFDVMMSNESVGSGFCMGNICQYKAKINGEDFDETYIMKKGKDGKKILHVVGGMSEGQDRVAWRGIGRLAK